MDKKLTIEGLKKTASHFPTWCNSLPKDQKDDGKSIGTYLEDSFKADLRKSFTATDWGNSAKGVDLPTINTDIKFTSAKQPQSSIPYKYAKQKIYGVGYNIILFVYVFSKDNRHIYYPSITFINESRTSDYMLTKWIRKSLQDNGNEDDIYALLCDRNLPGDDITYKRLVHKIMNNEPKQGYLTLSNALQWRAQYRRVIKVAGTVKGVEKLYAE